MGLRVLAYVGDFLEFPQSGFTVSDATLKNKRELIKKLLRGTLRGLQFTLKNRAETVRFIAKDYKLQDVVADKVYTSLLPAMSENGLATDKGLKVMIETLGTAVGKNVDFPPERLVDYTLVERSAKRIGRAVKGRSLMSASNRAIVFLSLLFPVAFVLGIAAPIFSAEAPQKVRIAYASRSSSAMPQYMALQKGYFKAEGLEVEIIQMNPRLGATAVVNGDVSFATPFTSTFRGVLQGFPMKLVFIHLKKGPYYVMVRPDIKDVQQLKGKTHRRGDDQRHGSVGGRRDAAGERFQSKSASSRRHRRRASAHAGADQRRGGSDLCRAAARFDAQKNGLSGVGRPAGSGSCPRPVCSRPIV